MKFFRDGLEEEIDSPPKISTTRDGHTVESYLVKGKKRFFVTISGTPYCAHGSTLSQAISDALWKDESKRPSLEELKQEIQAKGVAHKITLSEFRVLTGACAEGCRIALERAGLDGSPMRASEILKHFPEWGRNLYSVLEWGEP
jgi:hypothetical protein